MDLYRFSVFAHIFFSILLVGMALFWIIMHTALRRRFDAAETIRLLNVAQGARWPHVAIPHAWRLPLPWLGWAIILALFGSGILNLVVGGVPQGPWWWAKLALVVAIAALQFLMTRRARPGLYRAWFVLVLATIPVAGWVIR